VSTGHRGPFGNDLNLQGSCGSRIALKGAVRRCRGLGKIQRHLLLGLIGPTAALHEPRPWCLGILHGPNLGLGVLLGPDLCSHAPHLCPDILHDLCSGILHEPDLFWGILHDLCLGILHGLYGWDLCLCIFLGRPSLELIQQGFG
jgi:hypothetical protein